MYSWASKNPKTLAVIAIGGQHTNIGAWNPEDNTGETY